MAVLRKFDSLFPPAPPAPQLESEVPTTLSAGGATAKQTKSAESGVAASQILRADEKEKKRELLREMLNMGMLTPEEHAVKIAALQI